MRQRFWFFMWCMMLALDGAMLGTYISIGSSDLVVRTLITAAMFGWALYEVITRTLTTMGETVREILSEHRVIQRVRECL